MLGVFKREVKAYFRSVSGYLYLAAFFMVCGYFFVLNNLIGGVGDISGVYSEIHFGIAILVPLLTCDTLTAQTGNGVEYTLYISGTQLVMGKFFALLALTVIGIVGTGVYTAILAIFCRQDVAALFFNQIGLVLLTANFISIGMFASVISYRRTQAVITTYTLLLMFYMLDRSYQSIAGFSQVKTVWMFSIFSAYGNFELGLFSPTGVLGMMIFCLVVLAMTTSMLKRRKERGT